MRVNLGDRVALVTGAGRGIGKTTSKLLAENGATVVVNDIDSDPGKALVETIEEDNGSGIFVQGDITDEEEVAEMFERIQNEIGTVDILVNNAGVAQVRKFMDKPDADIWERQIDTHLWGAINCCKHAMDGMVEKGYGKIINLTSIHTKNGVGMSPQYDVAKYSLLGLTKTLALELGREGIQVNAVAPGWTRTRMTEGYPEETREQIMNLNPTGRFAEPIEIARAIAFLASPASDYVNGHELRVDGGQQPIDNWRYF